MTIRPHFGHYFSVYYRHRHCRCFTYGSTISSPGARSNVHNLFLQLSQAVGVGKVFYWAKIYTLQKSHDINFCTLRN